MRRIGLVFLAALALRAACAVITERAPLFPPHYYIDAAQHHRAASRMVRDWREGRPAQARAAGSLRAYDYYVAGLYFAFGPRPLAPKLVNAALGAAAVVVLYRLAAVLVGPAGGLLFGLALAFWPSHAYFSGQNLKDAGVLLLVSTAAWRLAVHLRAAEPGSGPAPPAWRTGAGIASLLAVSLFKSYFLPVFCSGAAAAYLAAAWGRDRRVIAAGLLWTSAALAAYRPAARLVFERLLAPAPEVQAQAADEATLLPRYHTPSGGRKTLLPVSPAAIQEFRDYRHFWDQHHSVSTAGRRIETQIYPGYELRTWSDLLRFLPRSAFAVSFMPLPGLYPLEGRLGRWLAAVENVALLALFVAAAFQFATRRRPPEWWLPAMLFAAFTGASALFEYDLGSAARHKLEYMPLALVFAFRAGPLRSAGALLARGLRARAPARPASAGG